MIRAAGLPIATTPIVASQHRNEHAFAASSHGAPYDASVFALNADGLLVFSTTRDFAAHSHRPRVGVWYWEVGVLPEAMRPAAALVDEVWCASEHVRAALAEWIDKPVRKHPLVFETVGRPTTLLRSDLGLPADRYLFGLAFDYASVPQRKNPLGLIDAYCRGFDPDDGAVLVVKSINAVYAPLAAQEARAAAQGRRDIVFIDRHFDGIEMRAFYQLVDCYVSLHRSEGLGLTLASAMAAGTPVIATAWSGNLEFMDETNSMLVPYSLTEVGPGCEPYPADARWAEPDLDVAARLMRQAFEAPEAARLLGQKGRRSIAEDHPVEIAAAWFEERLANLTGREVLV